MGVVTEGIIAMPYELAMADELTRMQFYQTVTSEIATLRARLETVEADRAAQAERIKELEDVRDFVARWAWRTDPPNATGHLTDADRLSCIKHHPTIKKAAQPHIDLAEAEAIRNLEPRHD